MLQAGPIQHGLLLLNNQLHNSIQLNLIYECRKFFNLIFLPLFYESLRIKDICISYVTSSLEARAYHALLYPKNLCGYPWQAALNRPPGLKRIGNRLFNLPGVT